MEKQLWLAAAGMQRVFIVEDRLTEGQLKKEVELVATVDVIE
jgi:hypothetical protein